MVVVVVVFRGGRQVKTDDGSCDNYCSITLVAPATPAAGEGLGKTCRGGGGGGGRGGWRTMGQKQGWTVEAAGEEDCRIED